MSCMGLGDSCCAAQDGQHTQESPSVGSWNKGKIPGQTDAMACAGKVHTWD